MSREYNTALAIARFSGAGFVWGASDCCSFARSVVTDVTGFRIAEFGYSNEVEARAIVRLYGGMEELLNRVLGLKPSTADAIDHGDPVLLDVGEDEWMAVGVRYQNTVVCRSHKGFRRVPLDHGRVICGWHVPCLS